MQVRNLIFLSGPQGAGKTTLMKALDGPEFFFPELHTRSVSLDVEPELRAALKICQRSLENFECLRLADENSDKIIIGNRCIYDQYAFNEVYERKGWISEKARRDYDRAAGIFYPPVLRAPRAIVLNPGFEVVWRHLHARWKTEKKWREEDEEYIRLACRSYEKFAEDKNVLYINHEIDLNCKKDFEVVRAWSVR